MRRIDRLLVLSLVLVLGLGSWPSAQEIARAPYRLFDSQRGFTAWTAPGYEQIPAGPAETIVVGRFVRTAKKAGGYALRYRATYDYLHLDDKVKPAYYLRQQYKGRFKVVERRAKRISLAGVSAREFHLSMNPDKPAAGTQQEGLAVFFRRRGAYAAFVGIAPESRFKKERPVFRKLGYSIRFPAPGSAPSPSAPDPYARSELRGIEDRRRVRAKLIGAYKGIDTEHYLIVYHAEDRAFANKLKRDLEIVHAFFRERWPLPQPVTAVATVRICRTREEYYLYGGRTIEPGYWNPKTRELVVENVGKSGPGESPDWGSRFPICGQVFRQYVAVFAGAPKAHMWFSDGHGDYFSGAVLSRSKREVRSVRVHPKRAEAVREAVRSGEHPSLEQLLGMSRAAYYRPRLVHQAMAWSAVYFLRTSRVARENPAWSGIPDTYFQVLRKEQARLTAGLGEEDASKRIVAERKARAAAVAAALNGVDMAALEEAWKKFVLRLRPSKR